MHPSEENAFELPLIYGKLLFCVTQMASVRFFPRTVGSTVWSLSVDRRPRLRRPPQRRPSRSRSPSLLDISVPSTVRLCALVHPPSGRTDPERAESTSQNSGKAVVTLPTFPRHSLANFDTQRADCKFQSNEMQIQFR